MYRVHFWTHFKDFDPLGRVVPSDSLSQLPAIAERARSLLQGRTRAQLVHVVETIFWMLDEHFQREKDAVVKKILESGGWVLGYLDYESRNEQGLSDLLDNWPEDSDDQPPDYSKHENTSELAALIECLDEYSVSDDLDFPCGKAHEYFAVLALWKVKDCIECLSPSAHVHSLQQATDQLLSAVTQKNAVVPFGSAQKAAVEELLEASEAVCWAERVKAFEDLTANNLHLRLELADQRCNTEQLAAEMAKKRVSVAASKAAIARHSEDYALRAEVFAWCDKHLRITWQGQRMVTTPSMDEAAESIAGRGKVVPVKVRTARKWIALWAKQCRSARRA